MRGPASPPPAQCVAGPLHYDENENLHAVVRGVKRFDLFHPAQGTELYDGTHMRTRYHLWAWDNASMRGHLHGVDPLIAPPRYMPFSPVRLAAPDFARQPAFARARRLTCEVHAGEVLYLPSYWWHDVRAVPTRQPATVPAEDPAFAPMPSELGTSGPSAAACDTAGCGLTASVNYFFTPYFRKANDLQHFSHEPFYEFLRSEGSGEAAADPLRWRRRTKSVER